MAAAQMREAPNTASASMGNSVLDKRYIRIAIDPGHGGKDPGTQSLGEPKYQEKYLALATSLMLEKHLIRLGYAPFLTRERDEFLELQERVDRAHGEEADLFVSVHYNAAPNRQAHGVEVFFYEKESNGSRREDSRRLASDVLEAVVSQTQARKRGVKHGNFLVIRNTHMPSILVEGGFVSNTEEMRKLADPEYLNKVAWGIARGIDDYLIDVR